MQTYKELQVWQRSMELAKNIYETTSAFPKQEIYGIVSQMRRAAVSIPSNLAEGYARRGKKENAQFVNIAYGSALELETQLLLSKDLEFIQNSQYDTLSELLISVQKLLYKYREYLKS